MKKNSGKLPRHCLKVALMKEKNQLRSRTSNHCVLHKKTTNRVISHLMQKQLEKPQ